MDWTISGTVSRPTIETPSVSFNHRVIVGSILMVLAVIGLFGNALVIVSVVVAKELRTITNVLVVNLAIADFISCSVLPFQSTGLLSQTGSYPLPDMVCTTVAGIGYVTACCSVSTLVAIAFVRWYVITRRIRGHRGIHTPRNIAIVVVIIWIESIAFMIIPPVLGFGTLGYSEYYNMCSLVDTTNKSDVYYVILQGVLIAVALLLSLMFYVLIWRHVLRHNKQFRDTFEVDNGTGSGSNQLRQSQTSSVSTNSRSPMFTAINKREIAITKNLFTVVCVFMICYLPSSVNFFIPGSSVFTLYSTMIILMNSALNPIIYGLKHPNFQEIFKKILCCRCG